MFLPHDNFSIFQYDNNINQLRLIGLVARPGSIMGGEVPRHFQAISILPNHCIHFSIEKRHISDSIEATGKLSKLISTFIHSHYNEFLEFDCVKIYYDNGQIEVSKILSSVFNALLPEVYFRKAVPADYKLFQVADLFCTMHLVKLKMDTKQLSKSELSFFGNERDLKKNHLKPLARKEWL